MKKSIIFESLIICLLVILIPISSAIEIQLSNKTDKNNSSDSHINSIKLIPNEEIVQEKKSHYVIIPGDSNKEFYAIIAGCTKYEDSRYNLPGFPWKPFPESTMKYVYEVINDSSNWNSENIVLLFNENATKQKIVDNLIDMGKKIDGDDIFLFSWTGHGTQVKDIDGDEGDGLDEAIRPYDTDYENVITDDELDSYFSRIGAEGLFLMFESCYSGGLIDVEAQQNYSFVDVDDDRRVVVMSTPPDKKGYGLITMACPISMLYSIALSNNSCDTNLDGWISAEEAFTFVNETYPFFENEMWLETINQNVIPLATLLVFILTNKILKLFRIKPELRLILSTLYAGFAYILYRMDWFQQAYIESILISYERMGVENNPNICDDYLGELNIIKIE
jgi:hypothetical protein